jgi:hypothetical protein
MTWVGRISIFIDVVIEEMSRVRRIKLLFLFGGRLIILDWVVSPLWALYVK